MAIIKTIEVGFDIKNILLLIAYSLNVIVYYFIFGSVNVSNTGKTSGNFALGYTTFLIIVIIYDVVIVIVYDVTLLLSMTYQFQSRSGKTDCMDRWVIKQTNQVSPSIRFRVPHFKVPQLK